MVQPKGMWHSLQNQILLPVAGLLLITTGGMGAWQAWSAARERQSQLEAQIQQVVQTILHSNFPLTDRVCQQMRGLTGADFVVTGPDEKILASSRSALKLPESSSEPRSFQPDSQAIRFTQTVQLPEGDHYWIRVGLGTRGDLEDPRQLHVLYPTREVVQQRGRAIGPAIVVSASAFVLAAGLATLIARRITSPLRRIREQIQQIPEGEFKPIELPARPDEVHALVQAINRMAEQLRHYERVIRETERLRTLGTVGGGLAHQLRNSATGARLAIDLHRETCRLDSDHDALAVATRQLQLIEHYLQKFLTLGQPTQSPHQVFDLREILRDLQPILSPFAAHHRVVLTWPDLDCGLPVHGNPEAIADMISNLLLNAIQAASQPGSGNGQAEVICRVESSADPLRIEIVDNGPGVPGDCVTRLFEPFVSGKPDGIGLGLYLAEQTCRQHLGELEHIREAGWTRFVIRLPRAFAGIEGSR